MKQNPVLNLAEKNMLPGRISSVGFLGHDTRKLVDILLEDGRTVAWLKLSHQILADKMEALTIEGRKAFGNPVLVDDIFQVVVEGSRGYIACPFHHIGVFPKENVHVKNIKTGESISWTVLNIHMIREHGFYEGKGSPFRVEPTDLARILNLVAD